MTKVSIVLISTVLVLGIVAAAMAIVAALRAIARFLARYCDRED